jgi:hypothetical protein
MAATVHAAVRVSGTDLGQTKIPYGYSQLTHESTNHGNGETTTSCLSLSMALSASFPLVDIFPWSIHEASTIVIVNSSVAAASLDGNLVDVDGRFLLYQIVSHVLSSPSGGSTDGTSGHRKLPGKVQSDARLGKRHRVLWLSSKPVTPRHIVNGLKKIGLTKADELTAEAPPRTKAAANTNDATVTSPSPESGHPNLVVRSVMEELGAAVLKQGRHVPSGDDLSLRFSAMDRVEFVKRELYGSIWDWVSKGEASKGGESKRDGEGNTSATSSSTSWIVMDDVDTLAALLGERLVSGLIQSVQALAVSRNVGLVIQCCSSDDENSEDHGSSGRWVGASGTVRGSGFDGDEVQLSPLMAELADYMVDVCPLKSGPTREAHGRLVLTTMRDMTSAHFNYCLADNRATAIRIRQHPAR